MKGIVVKFNHEIAETSEQADVIVLNTCIVKGPTENRMKHRISELSKLSKPVIITGCMPDARLKELRELAERYKNIRVLGTKNIQNIMKIISSHEQILLSDKEIKLSKSKIKDNPVISVVQISEGCLGNCSYCATKLAKGSLFSFPEQDILQNIEHDLSGGSKELWITSQDNSVYMLDKTKKSRLPDLLNKILNLPYEFFLRIGMMNPKSAIKIKNEIAEILNHPKTFKFLHIPVQSGSDKILKLMNRDYTIRDFTNLVAFFRENVPDLTLATDIIVGFPGETEEDFRDTLKIVKKIKPDILNISRFWPMKGTKASKLKQIEPRIIKNRIVRLFKLYRSIQDNFKWIGWSGKCIIDNKSSNGMTARNPSYKKILLETKDETLLGKFVSIQITNIKKSLLIGKMIDKEGYQ